MRGKFLFAAVIGVIVAAGGILLGTGSPIIERIEIEGGGRIGNIEIQALSGLRVGEPWSATRKESARRAILDHSLVRNISIYSYRSSLQGVRLRVVVDEREPVGVVELADRGRYWVDRQGFLLEPADDKIFSPVLSEVEAEELPDGDVVLSAEGVKALGQLFELPGHLLGRIQSVKLMETYIEIFAVEGWRARLPVTGLHGSMTRLGSVISALAEKEIFGWNLIDLRFEGEVTVRY